MHTKTLSPFLETLDPFKSPRVLSSCITVCKVATRCLILSSLAQLLPLHSYSEPPLLTSGGLARVHPTPHSPFSPEPPLYPGSLTEEEKIHKAVEMSIARAHYLHSQSSNVASPNNIRLQVGNIGYFYVVEMSIGTPPVSRLLLMDTGSGVTWTQCEPCVNCFPQTVPVFDTASSSSYTKIPCGHPLCAQPFQCIGGECKYEVRYGGGAVTRGLVSTEAFRMLNEQGGTVTVLDMVFGCGNDNQNFTFSGRKMSGILGLNNFRESFVSQMSSFIQGRFSYCLVYRAREMNATSLLKFGEDVVFPSGPDVRMTRIVQQNRSDHYFLNLLDISVADRRLGFAPGTFALQPSGAGGCIMDTGATATFLEEGPFNAVMTTFDDHFKEFGLERIYNASSDWKFCYRYNPQFRAYIGMTFHFEGADYVVDPSFLYFHFRDKFCVGIMMFQGKTIVGSWQQQDMRIMYDLNLGYVRWVPANCAAD